MKNYCSVCQNKTCITTGKPCQKIENYLQRKKSDKELLDIDRLYTDRWIREKEIPTDPAVVEWIKGKRDQLGRNGMSRGSDID